MSVSATPIGAMETWSPSLRLAVDMILATKPDAEIPRDLRATAAKYGVAIPQNYPQFAYIHPEEVLTQIDGWWKVSLIDRRRGIAIQEVESGTSRVPSKGLPKREPVPRPPPMLKSGNVSTQRWEAAADNATKAGHRPGGSQWWHAIREELGLPQPRSITNYEVQSRASDVVMDQIQPSGVVCDDRR